MFLPCFFTAPYIVFGYTAKVVGVIFAHPWCLVLSLVPDPHHFSQDGVA